MRMILRIGRNRAFTFIELMLSVVILSVGLIWVLQAFSFCVRAAGLARDITLACLLAENKIQELEIKTDKGLGVTNHEEAEENNLSWNYDIIPLEKNLGLKTLTFRVERKGSKKENILQVTTYLKGQ